MTDNKFRVWCSNRANPNGKMYYGGDPIEVGIGNNDHERAFAITSTGDLITICPQMGQKEHVGWARWTHNSIVVMKFAGFTDRHDKDIYEGDIVKFHYFYMGQGSNMGATECEAEVTGVIEWSTFGWAVKNISGKHWEGYTGYGAGEGESNILDLYAMNEGSVHEESFKVIGNIHENPELLK